MQVVYERFAAGEEIPVAKHLKNRKLSKYFNRETAAFIIACDKLLQSPVSIASDTPFYYSMGTVEYEDYGLPAITEASRDSHGHFSATAFATQGMVSVSPLTQFKILYNMPLCFASIEHGLNGDNAVLYSSVQALLQQALCAPGDGPVLLGAGKVHTGGLVECGVALVSRSEVENSPYRQASEEAIHWFRELAL